MRFHARLDLGQQTFGSLRLSDSSETTRANLLTVATNTISRLLVNNIPTFFRKIISSAYRWVLQWSEYRSGTFTLWTHCWIIMTHHDHDAAPTKICCRRLSQRWLPNNSAQRSRVSRTCELLVACSGFLSSLMRRNRGNLSEMPFSGSIWTRSCDDVAFNALGLGSGK